MAVIDFQITNRKFVLAVICLLSCLTVVSPSLVEIPQSTVAMRNSGQVEFKCKSDEDLKLSWWMQRSSARRQILYDGHVLSEEAESFCRVENEDHGRFHLNITTKDVAAQTYICHEPDKNNEASAELIIIDNETKCEQRTNDSHVTMTCYIEFRGNWAPELEWSHDGTSIAEGINNSTVQNKSVSSTLTIPVNDTGRYTCTTRFDIGGKPAKTTSTIVPEYIHKSNLTVVGTQAFVDETDNGTSTSLVIGLVVLIIILVCLIAAIIYRRQRRKPEAQKSGQALMQEMIAA